MPFRNQSTDANSSAKLAPHLKYKCKDLTVERCRSGRTGSPGTRVGSQGPPGFESLSLRQEFGKTTCPSGMVALQCLRSKEPRVHKGACARLVSVANVIPVSAILHPPRLTTPTLKTYNLLH